MKGFVHDGDEQPQICPGGHRIDDADLTSSVGTPEKADEAFA